MINYPNNLKFADLKLTADYRYAWTKAIGLLKEELWLEAAKKFAFGFKTYILIFEWANKSRDDRSRKK